MSGDGGIDVDRRTDHEILENFLLARRPFAGR
jgi:hypothetical protein